MKILAVVLAVACFQASYAMQIIISDDQANVQCDSEKGEVFMVCGTACPLTCGNRLAETHECSRECVAGCFCPEGKVRRETDNKCVSPEECHPDSHQCDPSKGEVYVNCPERSGCPDTCENYLFSNRVCLVGCVAGCSCPTRKVRRENDSMCVFPSECPPPSANNQCDTAKGEVFLSCGSACPDTCENYQDRDRMCTLQCVIGCGCPPGKVRRNDSYCVLPHECSETSSLPECEAENGEMYQACGANCEQTCDNYFMYNSVCFANCQPGCLCTIGKVRRASDNRCVPVEECPEPMTCDTEKGEVYLRCACPKTCSNHMESQPCHGMCFTGCGCPSGTVQRESDGHCVTVEDCP